MYLQLVIVAYDSLRTNRRDTLVCTIDVARNQNAPKWLLPPYVFTIPEDKPYISGVGNVTAVDDDPGVCIICLLWLLRPICSPDHIFGCAERTKMKQNIIIAYFEVQSLITKIHLIE